MYKKIRKFVQIDVMIYRESDVIKAFFMKEEKKLFKNPIEIILFMYLIYGPDYPSNISRNFISAEKNNQNEDNKKNKWDSSRWGFSSVTAKTHINKTLLDMEYLGILTSEHRECPDKKISKNRQKASKKCNYFSINPRFFTVKMIEEYQKEANEQLTISLSLLEKYAPAKIDIIGYLNTCSLDKPEIGIIFLIATLRKLNHLIEKYVDLPPLDRIFQNDITHLDGTSFFNIDVPLNMDQIETEKFVTEKYDLLIESLRTVRRDEAIHFLMDDIESHKKLIIKQYKDDAIFENDNVGDPALPFLHAYEIFRPPLDREKIKTSLSGSEIPVEEIKYSIHQSVLALENFSLSQENSLKRILQKIPGLPPCEINTLKHYNIS